MRKARCYYEYCCNPATFEVVTANRSGNPAMAPIEWGWCHQHKHHSWTARTTTMKEN